MVAATPSGAWGPDEMVAPGEKGEIIASLASDEAFAGYWNRPDADAKALREGWYFTGDMGYLDADGELLVCGRVDDMIISGGENIHPVEVEEVLASHPDCEGRRGGRRARREMGRARGGLRRARRRGTYRGALDQHCREQPRPRQLQATPTHHLV